MISLDAYCSRMISIATGWLDWPFDVAMRADVLAIELAYSGKVDMLKAIYGSSDETPAAPSTSKRTLTPELFAALIG